MYDVCSKNLLPKRLLRSTRRHALSLLLIGGLALSPAIPTSAEEEGGEPTETTETTNTPIRQQLRHLFALAHGDQVPTGILLQAGAVFSGDTVRRHSMPEGSFSPLDRSNYLELLGTLEAGTLFEDGGDLIQLDAIYDEALRLRQEEQVYPLSLAVIDYDDADEAMLADLEVDEEGRYLLPPGPVGTTRRLTAAAMMADTVYGPDPTLMVPSSLLLTNLAVEGDALPPLEIRYTGSEEWVGVPFDEPFIAAGLHADFDGMAQVELRTTLGLHTVETISDFPLRTPIILPSLDLPPVTDPETGSKINLRVYPGPGRVLTDGTVLLKQPLIAVDGFDVTNSRTLDDVWSDFGAGLSYFRSLGFDVIIVDYAIGNDRIEFNGNAIREFLVNVLPTLMAPGYETVDAVLVGGSMGSQTSNYALVQAETQGLDHNVGLFISIDGPFLGANIPIGLQAFVEFLAPESEEVRRNLVGLNSPAASQLLLYNRSGGGWYLPRPERLQYASNVATWGLPSNTRNVAVASGSGSAKSQNANGNSQLMAFVDEYPFLDFGIHIEAWSDHTGQVFHGKLKSISPQVWPPSLNIREREQRVDLQVPAARIDLAPGGYRRSGQVAVDGYNNNPDSVGTMTSDLEKHNFVPTYSALSIDAGDVRYQPSLDPNVFQRTPFDALFWENCNKEHVEATPDNLAFVGAELVAFKNGITPAPQNGSLGGPCGSTNYVYWSHLSGNGGSGTLGYWNINGDDHHVAGDFDGDGRDDLFHAREASRWMQLNRYLPASETWQYFGGNGGSGRLDDSPWISAWPIEAGDRYVAANFDGDPEDELLVVKPNGRARIVELAGGQLTPIWDNGSSAAIGSWNLNPDDQMVAGDFDNDGYDELLAINPNGFAHLQQFNGSGWSVDWWNNPPTNTGIGGWQINGTDRYVAGDFDNDGYDELLAVNPGNGWAKAQHFVAGSWQPLTSNGGGLLYGGTASLGGFNLILHPQAEYHAGDFDDDGHDEVLAIDRQSGESHTVEIQNGAWVSIADNGSSKRFALWRVGPLDTYLSGNFAGGGKDRVVMIYAGGEQRMHQYP